LPSKKIKRGIKKVRHIVYKETSHQPIDNLWAFIGSFIAISTIGLLQDFFHTDDSADILFLIGSFGATSVLLFGATNSPLAQPRNLFFGNLISALVGVTMYQFFHTSEYLWLSPSLAVATSILVMQYTKTMHPPGGATALIANIGSAEIKGMGYFYVINPVLTGTLILFILALLLNNLSKNRVYPYRQGDVQKMGFWEKIKFWKS
jgi:CBS domain-containing membrane protein